ncbi:outer membrane beta-barrel protein [Empedobacter brevis]|uniref:Outer membrane beta-barrel protein n=1 Tax=Empedobacter brevis TaxID=247 RepID=A0AAJ1V9D6_9FLAO|nr:outer membrane beta-barrel protein [Empedobacter brevis]MDM1073892.1 outer membrane beta-barrel protein [Empedobacter brevis]QHC84833.1 hypothetical protein AS589_08640 [Empedobacter brevis]
MKKLVLTLCVGMLSVFSYAQEITTPQTSANVGTTPIKQGNWIVGGSIGSLGYSFEGKNFNINFNPQAGYFISDGIAVGLGIGAGLQTVKEGKNIWNYKVAPFARYYFPEGASSTGRFFGQGDIGISGTGATAEENAKTSFAFGVNAGYAHFISRNVALEGTVGYNYSKSDLANAQAQNGLGLTLGFQIYLGHK